MPYHWERPTAEQTQRGIIAVYVLTHCIWIDGKNIPVEMPCPYRAINIERRIARGGDLPRWIEVKKPCADCKQDTGVFQYEHGKICGGCFALRMHGVKCFVPQCNRYTVDYYDDLPMCPDCMTGYMEGLGM